MVDAVSVSFAYEGEMSIIDWQKESHFYTKLSPKGR